MGTATENVNMTQNAEEIVRMYSDMVYGIALSHAANKADADDIFQDTFLVYFSKERIFNEEEHRKAWLIKVTLNCCKRRSHSIFRHSASSLDECEQIGVTFESKEENAAFSAVRALPEKYRTVVYLYYFEEMTAKETAHVLGIKEDTVFTRLSRARTMLRQKLKGEYFYE